MQNFHVGNILENLKLFLAIVYSLAITYYVDEIL